MKGHASADSPSKTYTPRPEPVRDYAAESLEFQKEFRALRDQWMRDTRHFSVTEQIAIHPAYLRIIGRGSRVIPLIMAEMRERPGLWFCALTALTGKDPVRPEHYGKLKEMTTDWLKWWDRSDDVGR